MTTRPQPRYTGDHRRNVIEDVTWLTDCGESPDHIAHRLGYASAANLSDSLVRWGQPSLARRLSRERVAA